MFRIDLNKDSNLSEQQLATLADLRKQCAGDIVRATYLAGSGHPGGSLSTLDMLLLAFTTSKLDNTNPRWSDRDRVIVSHGHISPAVYSVLASQGFIDRKEALTKFRLAGSPYSGHVEFSVPGVEWNTGNLGQGLSAGSASALVSKIDSNDFRVLVLMGDGEQQKGQISEARRFATKYKLSNLIAYIDFNGLQIGGDIKGVMPQAIAEEYRIAGWNVIEVDGHDHQALYQAWRKAYLCETENPDRPTLLMAKTVMGKGVSFMEGDHHFHGVTPNEAQAKQALDELGQDDDLAELMSARKALGKVLEREEEPQGAVIPDINPGTVRVYGADEIVDCRSGYGNALEDLGAANNSDTETKVLALTCDLEGSVKMNKFHAKSPEGFFEVGIQEHHAATLAGRLSWEGKLTFFSTFGVFAVAEGYNQQRLNDINHTNMKLVSTHCGLDVGEDGPTHQSIDWIALMSSPFGFKVCSPADANQCDRMVRTLGTEAGNVFMAMGRSKVPVITNESGKAYYDADYRFEFGKADWLREGTDLVIACFGPTVYRALEAHALLKEANVSAAVVNFGSLKPIDREAIRKAAKVGAIVSVEDHATHCGLGALIAQVLGEEGLVSKTKRLGVTRYGSSGKSGALFEEQGMAPEAIKNSCIELLGS